MISPSANTRVPKNTLVTLKCKPPAGVPRPTVSWWKDGRLLDSSSRGVLFGTDPNFLEVIIRKAKILHGGYYTCEVSNLAGSQKSSAIKLTVYGMTYKHVLCSWPLYFCLLTEFTCDGNSFVEHVSLMINNLLAFKGLFPLLQVKKITVYNQANTM